MGCSIVMFRGKDISFGYFNSCRGRSQPDETYLTVLEAKAPGSLDEMGVAQLIACMAMISKARREKISMFNTLTKSPGTHVTGT